MTQTSTSTAARPARPMIPSAQEIYDSIMQNIEPELTTASIPTLETTYANESDEEKKARAKRYKEAFAKYDAQYAQYMIGLHERVKDFRKACVKHAESLSDNRENTELHNLESQILSQ